MLVNDWIAQYPKPSSSTSQTSPDFIQSGGLSASPTPEGVPVTMMSPTSRVNASHARPPFKSSLRRLSQPI